MKVMGIIEEKLPNCVSIVLGFSQCLRVCLYKNFSEFQTYGWVHFGENILKLVEWANFKNFGFKLNVVPKNLLEYTNAMPNKVNGGKFVKGCSTYVGVYVVVWYLPREKKYRRSTRKGESQHVKVLNV